MMLSREMGYKIMNVTILGSVQKLRIEKENENENEFIKIDDDFMISNSQSYLLQELLTGKFALNIGKIAFDSMLGSNYVFGNFTTNDEGTFTTEMYGILDSYAGYMQFVLLSLWFVKDNSVNIPSLYQHCESAEVTLSNTRCVFNSTAKGEYVESVFTAQEIQQASSWLDRISTFMNEHEKNDVLLEKIDVGGPHFQNNNKKLPYDQFGRIPRALLFVQLARKESFLPLKITGYVGVLETIFSSDNNEISHQIAERVSLFLNGNSEEKVENYQFIKKIYGMRSEYVHGAKFSSKKYAEMENVCPILDELVRRIMRKVLAEYSYFNNASKNEITNTFLNMIFEKSDDQVL